MATKSVQFDCPDCGVSYLVQVPADRESARVECRHCGERSVLPAAAFSPDRRSDDRDG
jgi:predicted RNA-binding Zn-ribbon protein involved in translation (DUF1610 family)